MNNVIDINSKRNIFQEIKNRQSYYISKLEQIWFQRKTINKSKRFTLFMFIIYLFGGFVAIINIAALTPHWAKWFWVFPGVILNLFAGKELDLLFHLRKHDLSLKIEEEIVSEEIDRINSKLEQHHEL